MKKKNFRLSETPVPGTGTLINGTCCAWPWATKFVRI